MTTSTNTRRLAAVAAVFAAFFCFAAAAQAQRPAGMSKSEYRALVLRSEALNEKYHLGIWANKPASMSAQAYRAVLLRSGAIRMSVTRRIRSVTAAAAASAISDS